IDPTPLALGGNGAALGLLCAWAVPDLLSRARGEDYDGDLLGTLVIALVLLLMPLAVTEASAIAGFARAAIRLLCGLPLARSQRAWATRRRRRAPASEIGQSRGRNGVRDLRAGYYTARCPLPAPQRPACCSTAHARRLNAV